MICAVPFCIDYFVIYIAAEDDPLPAIEGLQISGEAFPGRELQASGYSINGTTSCNFEVYLDQTLRLSGHILVCFIK